MPQNRIPLKSYRYSPQGKRTVGRPKKRWKEQLYLWRRRGPNGPTLDVYNDDEVTANAATFLRLEAPNPGNLYKANINTLSFRNG
jgi:hypothetical protein